MPDNIAENTKVILLNGDAVLNNNNVLVTTGSDSPTLQSKTVSPTTLQQTVSADSGYDGLSQVIVLGDANLVSSNIKKDVIIFSVEGTYEGSDGGGGVTTRTINYISGTTVYYTDANCSVVTHSGAITEGVQAVVGTLVASTGMQEPMDFPPTGVSQLASISGRLENIIVYKVIQ